MKGYIQEVIQTFIYSGPYNGAVGGLGKGGLKNIGMRKIKHLPLLLTSYNPLWVSDFSIRSCQANLSNNTFVQFFTPVSLLNIFLFFLHPTTLYGFLTSPSGHARPICPSPPLSNFSQPLL